MDLDPFEPVGIGAGTIAFLDVFLLHCLLADSPPDTPAEIAALARNQHRAAERGREPGLRLERDGKDVPIGDWSREIVQACVPIAAALDAARGGSSHGDAVGAAAASLADPARLPSARVLHAMQSDHAGSYTAFVEACAEHTRTRFLQQPLSAAAQARWEAMAAGSVREQQRLEAADTCSFEDFRQRYLSAHRLVP